MAKKRRLKRKYFRAKCYWFSGISGTGVRSALEVISAEFRDRKLPVEIVSIEDEILRLARRTSANDLAKNPEASPRESGEFKRILDEAPSAVHNLWRQAAKRASKKATQYLRSGTNVLFTFHAVYYADKFGDFYSPINVDLLQKVPKPSKFFTFINDIGDVATRLREEGQVFANREKEDIQSVIAAVRDLLTILEWRATEITISRLLGTLMKCPAFVLAVKHPVKTATRILFDEGVPTYISHPISEIRRAFEKTQKWPSFMGEVQKFTNTLAASKFLIPIVPTAIDEWRFASWEIDGRKILLPKPLDRWDPPEDQLLVPHSYRENWLDPRGHFMDKITGSIDEKLVPEFLALDGLLQALSTRITKQINARDHILVEQCPHFTVYRPYMAWRITKGVQAEIEHRERLVNGRKGITAFFHKSSDKDLRKLGIIVEASQLYFKWVKDSREVHKDIIEKQLKDELEGNRPASFEAKDIESKVKSILKQHRIELGGSRGSHEARILGTPTSAESEVAISQLWAIIAAEVGKPDPWKKRADSWIEADLTPEQFAKKLDKVRPKATR